MAVVMVLLSLCVIQMTSSQSTCDIIQQENDVNSWHTEKLLTQMHTALLQLVTVNTQTQTAVSQMHTALLQLVTVNTQTQTAVSQMQTAMLQMQTAVLQLQKDVAEMKAAEVKAADQQTDVKGMPNATRKYTGQHSPLVQSDFIRSSQSTKTTNLSIISYIILLKVGLANATLCIRTS